jgi:hypothetical protein
MLAVSGHLDAHALAGQREWHEERSVRAFDYPVPLGTETVDLDLKRHCAPR